jgi:hypothetical protein
MINQASDFVPSEYCAQFGDVRLTQRLLRMADTLARCPALTFPDAFDDASQLEAAYRFFGNPKVTPDAVLEPHIEATLARAAAFDEIIVAHDTTEGRFEGEVRRAGCGPLAGGGYGFMAHVALAVADTVRRDPLGVLGLSTWVRQETDETAADKKRKQKKSRDDSESKRWIDMVASVEERLAQMAGRTRAIHVMDREADFYELLATMLQWEVLFVVRVQHDRVLTRTDGKAVRMSDVLQGTPILAEREVKLSRRLRSSSAKDRKTHPPRESRIAHLVISASPIDLPATDTVSELGLPSTIRLNVVQVREIDPPEGEEPVEWRLLTPLPIDTVEQVLRIVDLYRVRWMIEELFKALKTGCAFEERQLETADRLINALALFLPIAWQMLRMRHLARVDSAAPATEVLTVQQLDVLQAFVPKLPTAPTVKDALMAVAKLGGHLKSNGMPGWLVLGRGYQTLLNLEAGWSAALGRPTRGSSEND